MLLEESTDFIRLREGRRRAGLVLVWEMDAQDAGLARLLKKAEHVNATSS